VCNASTSASDNTTLNIRTWIYSCSFSTTDVAGTTYQVFALGVDASGRGLMTGTQQVTVTFD
jgi:hypothetical protein